MTLVKLNRRPFDRNLSSMVDDLFSELPAVFGTTTPDQWKRNVPVNIVETEKSYLLDVVAPGFDKADFKVNLEQNVLTIAAEKKEEAKQENSKQIRREYSFRSFKRSFALDEKINAAGIEAKYVNGILTLNLPKKEIVKPAAQEINIQ